MLTKNPAPEAQRLPILTFALGAQLYALSIDDVVEVAAMVEVTTVPDAPPELLGVVNRRGTILPLFDLRLIFRQPASPVTSLSLFIVVTLADRLAGLIVDEVRQVEYVDPAALQTAPTSSRFIRGIISHKDQLIQIVNLPALLAAFMANSTVEKRSM